MNVYPIYCQKCGKMLGITVCSTRARCPTCGDWIIIEKSADGWTSRKGDRYETVSIKQQEVARG